MSESGPCCRLVWVAMLLDSGAGTLLKEAAAAQLHLIVSMQDYGPCISRSDWLFFSREARNPDFNMKSANFCKLIFILFYFLAPCEPKQYIWEQDLALRLPVCYLSYTTGEDHQDPKSKISQGHKYTSVLKNY